MTSLNLADMLALFLSVIGPQKVLLSFARIGQPPADVLVSLSCDQVQAQNFIWPHKSTGLTPDSTQRIIKASQAIFGG